MNEGTIINFNLNYGNEDNSVGIIVAIKVAQKHLKKDGSLKKKFQDILNNAVDETLARDEDYSYGYFFDLEEFAATLSEFEDLLLDAEQDGFELLGVRTTFVANTSIYPDALDLTGEHIEEAVSDIAEMLVDMDMEQVVDDLDESGISPEDMMELLSKLPMDDDMHESYGKLPDNVIDMRNFKKKK
jgi:hypothetical protein